MSNADEPVESETWRSYVIRVSVDEEDITQAQYNELCERLCAAADGFLPDVDVMVSGSMEAPLGRLNYETYAQAVGGTSVRGDTLWTWEELAKRNPVAAAAWEHAAVAVADEAITAHHLDQV